MGLILHLFSSVCLIILTVILGFEAFTNHLGPFFIVIFVFGIPFITLNYLVSYLFKNAGSVYKFGPMPMIMLLFVHVALKIYFTAIKKEDLKVILTIILPFKNFNDCIHELLKSEEDLAVEDKDIMSRI